jgi:hypothetical protein
VFSSEVDANSREENTIKQGILENFRFNQNRKFSKNRCAHPSRRPLRGPQGKGTGFLDTAAQRFPRGRFVMPYERTSVSSSASTTSASWTGVCNSLSSLGSR